MNNDLVQKIEAALFYLAEPISVDFLAKMLEVSKKEVLSAVEELTQTLSARGVKLVEHDGGGSFVSRPRLWGPF